MKNIFKYIVIGFITFFSFYFKINAISNLTVAETSLIPFFDQNIYKYNIYVDENINSININYTKDEKDDFVEGIGKINLELGLNKLEIKVYKKDGTIDNYILDAYRGYKEVKDYESATLKSLKILGHDIAFNENQFEYLINISEDENNLAIKYEPTSEYSNVNLIGNSNLINEQNVITITVTSKDEKTSNIYTIKVNKILSAFKEEINLPSNKNFTKKNLIITIILIVLSNVFLIYILIKILFIRKKRIA